MLPSWAVGSAAIVESTDLTEFQEVRSDIDDWPYALLPLPPSIAASSRPGLGEPGGIHSSSNDKVPSVAGNSNEAATCESDASVIPRSLPTESATTSRISASDAAPTGMSQTTEASASGEEGSGGPDMHSEKLREKWIYVWDTDSRLYINRKVPGRFHHCSFISVDSVKAAGSIVVQDGRLLKITTWSGHYRSRATDISYFLQWLKSKGVNMETVQLLVARPAESLKAPKPNK